MKKSFRNVFLVTAVASAALLGSGCREGGKGRSGAQQQEEQRGTGGAGSMGESSGSVGNKGESGDMGPGAKGEELPGGQQGSTGDQSGSQPDTRR